jgi:Acetylglutamate kinase
VSEIEKKRIETAETLSEALPYMKEFSGNTFVIKFGGNAMGSPELTKSFSQNIVLMKQVWHQSNNCSWWRASNRHYA